MVLMKGDELANPNMIMDLILHQNPIYPILVATASSKPLDIKPNHTKNIVHIETNHMNVERLPTLNPSSVHVIFHSNSSILHPNPSMLLTLLSSIPSIGDSTIDNSLKAQDIANHVMQKINMICYLPRHDEPFERCSPC